MAKTLREAHVLLMGCVIGRMRVGEDPYCPEVFLNELFFYTLFIPSIFYFIIFTVIFNLYVNKLSYT